MQDLINLLATNVSTFDESNLPERFDESGLFDAKGILLPQPAAFWDEKTVMQRAMFGHNHGVYSLPTTEAVEHIKGIIAGRELQTIEIGAGVGCWGKALGIRSTDSYLQCRPDIAAKYHAMKQKHTPYGDHVEKAEAIKAVRKYRPTIVVAAWVPQKFRIDRFCMRGSEDGVDEVRLLELVDEYVMIGNTSVHGDKMVFEDLAKGVSTHRIESLVNDGVYSRAQKGQDFIVHLKRKEGIK